MTAQLEKPSFAWLPEEVASATLYHIKNDDDVTSYQAYHFDGKNECNLMLCLAAHEGRVISEDDWPGSMPDHFMDLDDEDFDTLKTVVLDEHSFAKLLSLFQTEPIEEV